MAKDEILTDRAVVGKNTYIMEVASTSTTDATPTTIKAVSVPPGEVVLLEARVTGFRTGGSGSAGDSAYYVVRARVKNLSGTITIYNVISEESEDLQSWNAGWTSSGNEALLQVTGAGSTSIDWNATIIKQAASPSN